MKFCFSTYASVLVRCKLPGVTQTLLISKLISSVDPGLGGVLSDDSITVSNYTRGTKNIPRRAEVYTKTKKAGEITEFFKEQVIPLLDQNKIADIVLAMKDIISKDDAIKPDTVIEHISKHSKKQLLGKEEIYPDRFLAGLFLYVIVSTNNKGSSGDVRLITDEYIRSFDKTASNIRMKSDDGSILLKEEVVPRSFEYNIDEDTFEKARLFCLDHEEDLHLLPLCEIASVLNPVHRHKNRTINDFIRQNKKTQKAILIQKSIRPYELCNAGEIDKCIDAFEKEVTDRRLTTIPFLYDDAKYLHRALTHYPDYMPESIDPLIPGPHTATYFPGVSGNLRTYIDYYEFGLEHHPEKIMTPPFDMLRNEFGLSDGDEQTLVFWVNRFIITVCHYLHGFDPDAQYDESWHYKDTIEDNKIKTMEELYYYALLLLYMSYGPEKEEK